MLLELSSLAVNVDKSPAFAFAIEKGVAIKGRAFGMIELGV